MTQHDAVEHWRKGAARALKAAKNSCESGDYEIALFSCHLAVEKALKALYLERKGQEPPKTHNLEKLCVLMDIKLPEEELLDRRDLTTYQQFSRYGDESWTEADTSKENVQKWVSKSKNFLNQFSS